jgi:ABC-2 type transport system permease protein
MIRTWHIFWREYWGNITRRSYLLFTFGFPIFMVVAPVIGGLALGLAIRMATPPTDSRPIGLIDQVGLLTETEALARGPVEVIFFEQPPEAAVALEQGQIQAYYDIQPDYWDSGRVVLTYQTAPTQEIDQMVSEWIEAQVEAKLPRDILTRLRHGPTISHHGVAAASSSYSQADYIEPIIVYLVIYFVRLAGSFTASYMFDSIASEAEDRTLEILVTTVSPFQFITGKLFGLLAVGLTQIGMWLGAILIGAVGVGYLVGVDPLSFLWGWKHLGLVVSVLLATYLLDQLLAAGMGLLRVSGGAGNLLFNTINSVVGISLIYAAYFVPRNPQTPVAVMASLFPLTAPLVLLIRVVVSQVPSWQVVVSQLLLWASCVGGLFWLHYLLKANLVSRQQPFSLRRYLQERLLPFRKLNSTAAK